MGTSKDIADTLGARSVHEAEPAERSISVGRRRQPFDASREPCTFTESEPIDTHDFSGKGGSVATSLDDYRSERLARLKRQNARAKRELVELEQMRNEFRPLLLALLQCTKTLYPDVTKDTHLIVNALVDRLAAEIAKDKADDTRPESVRSSKRRKPR